MLRLCTRPVWSSVSKVPMPKRSYKNFVWSKALAQIEKDCEMCCFVPRKKWQKVTVIGAGTDIGQITSLFLKQQKVIKILSLYDDVPERLVLGVANDLAHIDTSTSVEAYQGRSFLQPALHNAELVLICGGCVPPCCNLPDRDLFVQNLKHVRCAINAVARVCPHAFVVVQTPPVDANFAYVAHTLESLNVYEKRRVIGVNSINAMRANQLLCTAAGADPQTTNIPVVGGTGRCTRVPAFSAAKIKNFPMSEVDNLVQLVREADHIICRVKNNYAEGHLSIGFSTARCVTNVMHGLFGQSSFVDSALVEQNEPETCYGMRYCSTPVSIGEDGIVQYLVPELSEEEKKMLEDARCDLKDMVDLGRCAALGKEYELNPCKIPEYE